MTDIFKLFEEEIWKPSDLTSCIWKRDWDNLTFNQDGDIDALMNGDGNTYTYEVRGETEKEGFVICMLQSDCGGGDFQAIFDLSKKVDEDKYWDEVDNEDEE